MNERSTAVNGLRLARLVKGLSQGQIADRVGASQQAVSFWESGKRRPRPELLRRLLAVLGEGR